MIDVNVTIKAFLDGAAAKQPTPGGGSVTALVGALAAAMGEMVVNYSVGKKGLEQHTESLKKALHDLNKARALMLALMVEDQSAYELVSSLRKMPENAKDRAEKYPSAMLACIRVPETMAATAIAILEICDEIVDSCNHYLLSDLAVCADLATATLRCAVYNVRTNVKDLTDAADKRAADESVSRLLARGVMLIQKVSPRIWKRHELEG